MNLQNIMAQAKKMQAELEKTNKEIENTKFIGKSQLVEIEMNGKKEVEKVTILEDITDKEMLEDMILLAMNDGIKQVDKLKETKLGKYTGGMGGLF